MFSSALPSVCQSNLPHLFDQTSFITITTIYLCVIHFEPSTVITSTWKSPDSSLCFEVKYVKVITKHIDWEQVNYVTMRYLSSFSLKMQEGISGAAHPSGMEAAEGHLSSQVISSANQRGLFSACLPLALDINKVQPWQEEGNTWLPDVKYHRPWGTHCPPGDTIVLGLLSYAVCTAEDLDSKVTGLLLIKSQLGFWENEKWQF